MELGVAGTIAVKCFTSDWRIDEEINTWLAENADIEVVDIKFASNATSDEWGNNALIIYRK